MGEFVAVLILAWVYHTLGLADGAGAPSTEAEARSCMSCGSVCQLWLSLVCAT